MSGSLFVYLAVIIYPISYVVLEKKKGSRAAVLYTSTVGGFLWILLTLLFSEDITFLIEPILLITMGMYALWANNEESFKYQPCVSQTIICILMSFNTVFFNLGMRYKPLLIDTFSLILKFDAYFKFTCSITYPLEYTHVCVDQTKELFEQILTKLDWEQILNEIISLSILPLFLHSVALAYVVYKRYDSGTWLTARLLVYPLMFIPNFIVFIRHFVRLLY